MKKTDDYTSFFEIFWKAFPSRWNSNLHKYVKRKKWPAFQAWQKLSPAIQQKCLRIRKKIKDAEGTPRDAVTWLNQRGWDDIDEPDITAQKLPAELTDIFQPVPSGPDLNNERNRQRKDLLTQN